MLCLMSCGKPLASRARVAQHPIQDRIEERRMSSTPSIDFTTRGPSEKTWERAEVEAAFQRFWYEGCVKEDWNAWLDSFTPDVDYVDHFWGPLKGREEVSIWIEAVMKGVPEIYTVLDWYTIDNDVVVFHCQNRRDNPNYGKPGETGPAYWDFPGLSVLRYGGDGRFCSEEDYWDRSGARKTAIDYAAACERAGAHTKESRMLRGYWPASPAWARIDEAPSPSWSGRTDVPSITKPAELRALLGRG
ncbi:nuclear transport factor 2 family protein [Sphingomonas crocodyli]|uniref:Nuclear transport factor 2 family protein n=2 Tax=Sphingomonas crocodyli TaxID=1979270 RepID=A0A437LWI8_9SPHN|nr:nuclear transport factor 2 family protein [Sphingomonas crocodyli]